MSNHNGHRKRLEQKVRERGLDMLAEHEQLEYILYAVFPRGDTNDLAHRLLDRFVTISGVINAEENELVEIEGIGHRAAAFLRSLPAILGIVKRNSLMEKSVKLDNIKDLIEYIQSFFYGKLREEVYLFSLNTAYRVLAVSRITYGIAGEVYLHPATAVKQALRDNAAVVIIAHNHPGGDVNPSVSDIMLNDKLADAFSAVEITFADSIIVSEDKYFSFREKGYMEMVSDSYYTKLSEPATKRKK